MDPTDNFQVDLDEAQTQLFGHRIFESVQTLEELKTFMQWHVFAVWDFMSLLKRMQSHFAPNSLPWVPSENRAAVRFINEIVLCEESDMDYDGNPASHLDMYLDAMKEIGADRRAFVSVLRDLKSVGLVDGLYKADAPAFVGEFVTHNVRLAQEGSIEVVAANFLYGREDSIPVMFERLLANLGVGEKEAPRMFHYLARHIEVDSGAHGPAAASLLDHLIQGKPEKQKMANRAALQSIYARIAFWDGLMVEILKIKDGNLACC